MLRRQRAIEIVPSSKPLRWRRYDVPQHLAPETSDALRFCAVEGDLDLLDRRHRSIVEAGSFVVCASRTTCASVSAGRSCRSGPIACSCAPPAGEAWLASCLAPTALATTSPSRTL